CLDEMTSKSGEVKSSIWWLSRGWKRQALIGNICAIYFSLFFHCEPFDTKPVSTFEVTLCCSKSFTPKAANSYISVCSIFSSKSSGEKKRSINLVSKRPSLNAWCFITNLQKLKVVSTPVI